MIELDERKLFELLREYEYEDLVHVTSDEYSATDCFSIEYGIYVELKCRKTHYDDLMIEKLKYDRLKTEADKIGLTPMYICSTPHGIWSFDLDTLPIQWSDRSDLPATTHFNNKQRITKTVGYLRLDKGQQLLPWYPTYDNPDQFIYESMQEYEEVSYVDPAEIDIDGMLLTDEQILAPAEDLVQEELWSQAYS